jgi:hypothetical protein
VLLEDVLFNFIFEMTAGGKTEVSHSTPIITETTFMNRKLNGNVVRKILTYLEYTKGRICKIKHIMEGLWIGDVGEYKWNEMRSTSLFITDFM